MLQHRPVWPQGDHIAITNGVASEMPLFWSQKSGTFFIQIHFRAAGPLTIFPTQEPPEPSALGPM
jgi:hypothetical protein